MRPHKFLITWTSALFIALLGLSLISGSSQPSSIVRASGAPQESSYPTEGCTHYFEPLVGDEQEPQFETGPKVAAAAVNGFDFPLGSPDGSGWLNNMNGLQFLQGFNYGGNCGFTHHPGHDFNKDGTSGDQDRFEPVYAVADGVVVDSAYYGTSTWGNVILIEHTLPDGTKVWSQYGHLEDRWVERFATVSKRQQIGRVGKGDGTLSAHLHFEMRKVSLSGSAFPCGQSQAYVTERYHNPINYINANRAVQGCNSGPATLRNVLGGPPVHPPGSVVKTASDPTVYLIDSDNRKRPLSANALSQLYNQSTDARTGTNFNGWVITIGQDELDLYELGGSLFAALPGNGKPFPDGKLIGFGGEVSIVTGGGRRRPFGSANTFTGLGFNFCQVVNVSEAEYNSYPEGPAVDAMPVLTASLNLSPSAPYSVGQSITGGFTIRNVGYQPITFTSLGIGGRLNGSTVYDLNFVSTTLSSGASSTFNSQPRQLNSTGTYSFFAAYQESNGHWAVSVPALPGVARSRQIVVDQTYTIGVSASPAAGGSAGGGGAFTAGSQRTVTATASSGYSFTNWTESGGVVSTSANYTFTLNSNRNLVANFTAQPMTHTITLNASPSAGGAVSGGGTFASGSSRTVTATANAGHSFTNWTENGNVVSTSASYSFTLNGNRNLVANFTPNPVSYTITTGASPAAGGTTTGDGTFAQGSQRTVRATANSGYSFTSWTEGGSVVSTSAGYTFTLDANRNLVANFTTVGGGGNVAAAVNGATATASSELDSGRAVSSVINGDRQGLHWGSDPSTGSGWHDATQNAFPDWVQVNFSGAKTINQIDVFTIQDNYTNPAAPTEAMTFSLYGIQDFEVQYWNGAGWAAVPGGSVTDNNRVWRKFSFSPLTTSMIRVSVTRALVSHSRIVEIEAYEGTAPPPPTDSVNVALASNGGVAAASSTLDSGRPASAVNNGDRRGLNWGAGGGWHDATQNAFPDWVQVDFNGNQTIDRIDVFTIQDSYTNPAAPTDAMTFSLYGATAFEVQYADAFGNWVTAPGGSVAGNNLVWRSFTFPAVTTGRIRVHINGALAGYSRLAEVEAWTPGRPNVALASNGAVATASSTLDSGRSAAGAINGDRRGLNWGSGGGWHDASADAFPDWLQVNFSGAKTISEVRVFTIQDNYTSPVEPTDQMTFSLYGVTAFEVQYWNGSGWVTVHGGSVSGNNLIKRTITFPPVSTDRVRVQLNNALAGYSRLTEVEVY